VADILVTENITGAAMTRLRESHDVAFEPELWSSPDLAARLADARAVIVRNQTQITRELIGQAGRLEIISRAGAGLDNVDTDAAAEAGIVVSYAPAENSLSVAELVLGLLLSLARRIPAAWADTRNGGWDRRTFTGVELSGRTLGIVGFGRIGRLVAERARAFGMRLLAHDEFLPAEVFDKAGAESVSLDQLLAESDAVSVHVPLLDSTRGLFGERQFAAMKPSAWFVSAARGEVVNEAALTAALQSGQIAAAALDVRETEPPVRGLLEQMDNVILTPHIGAFTKEAQERVVELVCRDVIAVLSGGEAASPF
jgi:D-3-phosphoglycerate dehydrogenase / 2-oxoglutarate reductase